MARGLGSDGVIFMLSFVNTGHLVQRLKQVETQTDRQTDRQHGDLVSL